MQLPYQIKTILHELLTNRISKRVFDDPNSLLAATSFVDVRHHVNKYQKFGKGIYIVGDCPSYNSLSISNGFIIGEPNSTWWQETFIDSKLLYERDKHSVILFLNNKVCMSADGVVAINKDNPIDLLACPVIPNTKNVASLDKTMKMAVLMCEASVFREYPITNWKKDD